MSDKLEKTLVVGVLSFMLLSAMIAVIQPAKAQFVIADLWEYPDEYGQGIPRFRFYENSTGSWVEKYSTAGGFNPTNESLIIEWDVGVGIKLRVSVHLNSTLHGLGSIPEGLNIIRVNVTVTALGETVFSEQNLTWFNYGQIGPIYSYNFDAVLNFSTNSGIYNVIVTYEIFGE